MTQKRKTTTSKRKTKRTPKPKVYIAPYKIIVLCAVIIAICIGLLITTSLLSKPKNNKNSVTSAGGNVRTEQVQEAGNQPIREPMPGEKKQETKQATVTKKAEEPVRETEQQTININVDSENETAAGSDTKAVAGLTPEGKTQTKPDSQSENQSFSKSEKAPEKSNTQKAATPAVSSKQSFGFPNAVNGAELVFVFDDGGHSLSQTEAFLDLPFPFTVAVLPRLKFSKESADLVRESGNEVILHQPMQALNASVDPGPGAITPDMDENQIISTLFQNTTEIGPIAGMNNHEGSAITADAEKMAVILRFASQEGIFFLDSRTNVDTAVPYVAGELGYSYYERNIFLDNEKTRDNILTELKKGLNIANKNGTVIMIGHIWSANILPGILKEVYPELKEKGYTFNVVSKSKGRK